MPYYSKRRSRGHISDTTEGSSVHSHVIRGTCAEATQLRQFNMVTHLGNSSRLSPKKCTPFRGKCPGLPSDVLDKVRSHRAQQTWNLLQKFRSETLGHLSHSPDLASSDFHLFNALKGSLARTSIAHQ
jgi:hypothetical protein